MYKIMSNRHSFREDHYHDAMSLEPTVLAEEDANDTMTDVNETYMTANGDNTQYFSILDSHNETILNEMGNVDFEQPMVDEVAVESETAAVDDSNGQVVLYRVDDSDELYGVQVLRDESGNMRKYQFKVRQTDEGILEALPDTLQILSLETNDGEVLSENQGLPEELEQDGTVQDEIAPHVFIKQEQNLEDILSEPDDFSQDQLFEENTKDTKEGILEDTVISGKQELFDQNPDPEIDFQTNGSLDVPYFQETISEQEPESMDEPEELSPVKMENMPRVSTHIYEETAEFLRPHVSEEEQEDALEEMPEQYEQLLEKEGDDEENGDDASELVAATNVESFLDDIEESNEDESEDYETVEGNHITGDGEQVTEDTLMEESIRESLSYQKNSGKRKITQNIFRRIKVKSTAAENTGHFYYLIRDPEKENLVTYPMNALPVVRTNPRSILKTSLPTIEPKKAAEDLERYDKRFAKSKEAQQARQFHNFIAQTKIIHAPVRQERLPRKQKIKPMERTDEEIVVQEVFVSSNGFVETSEDGVLKERILLQPTEFIQLSDTDEEVEKKNRRKRKGTKKSLVEITISDSDDYLSENEIKAPPPKRPRGRPPKVVEPPPEDTESSESEPGEIIILRVDNKCPKCPKSFPSEGSLRTHMQYHVYKDDTSEMKYICEKCGEQFKNTALLNRHSQAHITKDHICLLCKKVFSDQSQLIAHRRSHVKEQMFKNTILQKDSPKRSNIKKVKTISSDIKCGDCSKTFDDPSAMNIHAKSHKRFRCDSCTLTFPSKLTFDHHLRKDCLKSPKKRLKTKIIPPIQKELPGVRASTSGMTKTIKCDSCSLTFPTYTSLFKHKVSKHALEAPKERESLRTQKHSGVPISENLRKASLRLREKLKK